MCTGNTYVTAVKNITSTVYPCVYREHKAQRTITALATGLSLCVQGTLHLIGEPLPARRFIPVCTGNTSFISNKNRNASVYPCVYREHGLTANDESFCNRFIPVCTGNTPIITYCFIIKILTTKFLPIF